MSVKKAILKVTILFNDDEYDDEFFSRVDLCDIEHAINSDMVGQVDVESIEIVPATAVEQELLALGNDGDFFT